MKRFTLFVWHFCTLLFLVASLEATDDNSTYQLKGFLANHSNWIKDVAFSLDGTKIISVSTDHLVNIYDLNTTTLVRQLSGHSSPINTLAIHPTSPIIYSADTSGLVFAWSLEEVKELWQLQAHDAIINDIVASETLLVTASHEKDIKIWDIQTRELLSTLSEHTLSVQSLAISDDGNTLISGSKDTTIKIWDLKTFTLLRSVQAHNSDIYTLDINHKGDSFASGSSDSTVKIWDLQTGENLHSMVAHKSFVFDVKFAYNDTMLLSAGSDNTIKIWDTQNRCLLDNQKAHFDWVSTVDISQDDKIMISGGYDKFVRIFDLPRAYGNDQENCFLVEEVPEDFRFPARVDVSIATYATSSTTLAGIQDSSPISILNGEYRQKHISEEWKNRGRAYNGEIEVRHQTSSEYETSTSTTINIGGIKKTFVSTTTSEQTTSGNTTSTPALFPLTNVNLFTTLMNATYLDMPQGTSHNISIQNGEYRQWANWATSGLAYGGYIAFRHKSANTYDTLTSTQITINDKVLEFNSTTLKDGYKSNESFLSSSNFSAGSDVVTNTLFSHNQQNIITTTTSHEIHIWNTSSKELLQTISTNEPIQSLLLTYDDFRIISAHNGDTNTQSKIRIWDKQTGVLIHTLSAPSVQILAMAIDGNDQYLVVLSNDAKIFLWDLHTNILRSQVQSMSGLSTVVIDKQADTLYAAGQNVKIRKYRLEINASTDTQQKYIALTPYMIGQELGKTHAATSGNLSSPLVTLALTDDMSSLIVGGWDNELKVFDVSSKEPIHSIAGSNTSLTHCTIGADSKIAICTSANQEAHIFDIKQGIYLKKLPSQEKIYTLDLSQDGGMLVVGGGQGKVELFSMRDLDATDFTHQDWADSTPFPVYDNVPRLSYIKSGLYLPTPEANTTIISAYIQNGLLRQTSNIAGSQASPWTQNEILQGGLLEVRQLSSQEFNTKQLSTIQIGDTKKSLLSITQSNTGKYSDKYQLQETMVIHSHQIVALAITKDGAKVIYVGLDNSINVTDTQTRATLITIQETKNINDVEVSYDGTKIITGSENKINIWDIESGDLLTTIEDEQNSILSLKITPNDLYIISGGNDAKVKIWDASSGKLIRTLIGHSDDVLSLDISQDSTTIVSSSKDSTLKVWSLADGTLLHDIKKDSIATHIATTPDASSIFSIGPSVHARTISKIQINENATKIASASLDKTMKIWHLESRKLIDVIMELDPIHSFEFHPSSEAILIATGNKITLWSMNEQAVSKVEPQLETAVLPP